MRAMQQRRATGRPSSLAASLRGFGSGRMPPVWSHLSNITARTLLIAGEDDPKYVGIHREMARILPNAVSLGIPDAGHAAHLENPAATLAEIHAFMAGNGQFATEIGRETSP